MSNRVSPRPGCGGRCVTWLVLGATLPVAVISWIGGWIVRRYALRWGLVDEPGDRKVHTTPTPMGGGLAIGGAIFLAVLGGQVFLWLCTTDADGNVAAPIAVPEYVQPHLAGMMAQTAKLWSLFGGAAVLCALGLIDDLKGLDWRIRLGIQTLVACVVVASGWRLSLFVDVPALTSLLSVLWIVGLVNTFNMLDNMDGLSAGVAAISAGMLAAVMLAVPAPETHQPQLFVGGYLLLLVGGLVGFLSHNRPPAKLFMGDAGSYLVGFWIATGTIMATFAGGELPAHAILAPLCVLAVPLYDTTTVVAIRLLRGHSPFEADKNHFSHRLVELGLSKTQAVLTIYLTTATTGLGALLLYQVDGFGAGVILLLVACVLCVIGILETTARRNLRA